MHGSNGVPILGKAQQNGAANFAAIDKKYVVELRTADGGKHRKTFDFARPEMRATIDGAVDLGQIRDFDPREQSIRAISGALVRGVYGNPGPENPPMIIVDSGAAVVWRHVTSFQYLGSVDELKAAEREAARDFRAARTFPEAA